ncbi:MAG TPA: hypothetical protein VMH22_06250 [bacterium]|nr:hypothetical protein [bacterium]
MLSRDRLLAFLIVPVMLLTMSCHKKVSQGWFPLVLGSKWTYNLTGSAGNGTFTVSVTEVGDVKHYAKAVADSGVSLKNVFPFNNLDGDTSCFYTVSGDTTWLGPSGGSTPLMVMVQPLDSIASWRWTYAIWTDSAVVAGKTDVIVPAGTFKNCYEVDYYGLLGQLFYRVCYADGVGAVKGEALTSPTWQFELKSADLP